MVTSRKLLATSLSQQVAQLAFDGDQQEFCVCLQTQTQIVCLIHSEGSLDLREGVSSVIMIHIFQKVRWLKNLVNFKSNTHLLRYSVCIQRVWMVVSF